MKSEESTNKKEKNENKGVNAAHSKLIMLVFAAVVIICIVAVPLWSNVKKIIEEEQKEGYTTYNASRWFFRFDYKEDWIVDCHTNGFLLDEASGLVCRLVPTEIGEEESLVEVSGVSLSFYYKAGGVELAEAMEDFETQFSGNTYGELDEKNVESEKATLWAKNFTTEEGKTGTIYVATRTMAHYCIVAEYDNEELKTKYEGEISEAVRSFWLSVFDDTGETEE